MAFASPVRGRLTPLTLPAAEIVAADSAVYAAEVARPEIAAIRAPWISGYIAHAIVHHRQPRRWIYVAAAPSKYRAKIIPK